jgi:alpha-N-arabinofuranosidase
MNPRLRAPLFLLVAACACAAPEPVAFESFTYEGRDEAFAPPVPAGHFRNPILAGYYPDPSLCRVGEDYYLVNSSFAHFPGLPLFHSRDLVNWRQLGHVIDRPTQLRYDGLGTSRGLFAPALSHHGGTFYLVCTMIGAGGNFLVTATDPAGPWSDPIWLGFDGIDPSLFFAADGRAWLVNNGPPPDNRPLYDGHRAIWIQEFDPVARQLVGPRSIIVNGGVDLARKPVWIEGPHLFERDGWYYLTCAEGGTSTQHSQVVFRSRSPLGPFVPWDRNPILTQRDLDGAAPHAITCTGHADLELGPDGQWWAVFLACRPYAPDTWATGRETFLLPVRWTDDGWPQILPPGQRVPYIVPAPRGASVAAAPAAPLNGNFTWHDDFAGPTLSPLWIMLRAPHEPWSRLERGRLLLTPRAELLSGRGNPSFHGRRLQHSRFTASTVLHPPATPGTSAGLALVQAENHHYFFGVRRHAGGLTAFVESWDGPRPVVLAQRSVADTASLRLAITGEAERLSFTFADETDGVVVLVPAAAARTISVQAAGGGLHFTGALIGPHARVEP